jgi:hypothetical protein
MVIFVPATATVPLEAETQPMPAVVRGVVQPVGTVTEKLPEEIPPAAAV